jgi:hypothetical protein
MGGTLEAQPGAVLRVHATGVVGASAELVVNGTVAKQQRVDTDDARIAFALDARRCGWAAVNIRDAGGHPLLIGNPIYFACPERNPN